MTSNLVNKIIFLFNQLCFNFPSSSLFGCIDLAISFSQASNIHIEACTSITISSFAFAIVI